MSYQAVVPSTGLLGWRFLQRTYDSQFVAFSNSAQIQRDTDYFSENIGKVQSASDLVSDRRLLSVALGAFGLQDDIDNKYFIQKILEDGTTSEDALANKLTDNRYKKLSDAFGFGPGQDRRSGDSAEMAGIIESFRVQSFEESVGEQDDTMRIALYAQHELAELANEDSSEKAKWFTLMGQSPLRAMFETALGLPKAFGQLDIDKQLEIFSEKTRAATGDSSISQFSDPEALSKLTTIYLARAQITEMGGANSPGANALTLLQSIQA